MKAVKVIRDPEVFQLLGDDTRRRIMFLLRTRPMNVSQIAEELHLSPQTVYHHIQKLKSAEIVEVVKEERVGHLMESYYQSTAEVFNFTIGESPAGIESHKKLVKKVVDGLNQMGYDMEYNDEVAQEIADAENKLDASKDAEKLEETMNKVSDIDFLSRQMLTEVALTISKSDEEFEGMLRLQKRCRELYLSMKKPSKRVH
ncbi:MAG: winged helix-turn-helix domain-containing protein [Promethearchaeati archaeon SRVP18_Atabeyarchaeia-1]